MIVSTSCLVCTQHLNVNTMIFDLFSAKWYKKIAKTLWLAHCDSNDFCCEFNEIFHCKCSHNANPATNCQIANGRERSVAYSWVIWYMSSLDWIGSLHLASLVLISPWQAWHRYNNSVCLLCPFHQSNETFKQSSLETQRKVAKHVHGVFLFKNNRKNNHRLLKNNQNWTTHTGILPTPYTSLGLCPRESKTTGAF